MNESKVNFNAGKAVSFLLLIGIGITGFGTFKSIENRYSTVSHSDLLIWKDVLTDDPEIIHHNGKNSYSELTLHVKRYSGKKFTIDLGHLYPGKSNEIQSQLHSGSEVTIAITKEDAKHLKFNGNWGFFEGFSKFNHKFPVYELYDENNNYVELEKVNSELQGKSSISMLGCLFFFTVFTVSFFKIRAYRREVNLKNKS